MSTLPFSYLKRLAPPYRASSNKNLLVVSPRQTGKTYFVKNIPEGQHKADLYLDFNDADTFRKFSFQKNFLEKIITDGMKVVVIENFQRLPSLLDQFLALNKKKSVFFILTTSLTKGIDLNHEFFNMAFTEVISLLPLTSSELGSGFDLNRTLQFGSLPHIFNKTNLETQLYDYAGLIFQDDLVQTSRIKKVENFSRFLNLAAQFNGEYLNYEDIAKLAEVPSRTVREYYELLKTSLLGYEIDSYQIASDYKIKSAKRSKFYFFDLGLANAFRNNFSVINDFEIFQNSLKHFILLELLAYKNYKNPAFSVHTWCDYQNHEIDFILNENICIDIKGSTAVHFQHFKRLSWLKSQFEKTAPSSKLAKTKLKKFYLISLDQQASSYQGVDHIYYLDFLKKLWNNEL